jgi:hypothetical protein
VEEKSPKKAQRRWILIETIVTMRRGSRQGRFIVKSAITFESYGREMLGYSSRTQCEDWREKRSGRDKDFTVSLLQQTMSAGCTLGVLLFSMLSPSTGAPCPALCLAIIPVGRIQRTPIQLGPQDKGPGVTGDEACREDACRGARRL